MNCLNCGRALGFQKGAAKSHSSSWRVVNEKCVKVELCDKCSDKFKRCLPTQSEVRAFDRMVRRSRDLS